MELVKSPWEYEISKRAEEAQRKAIGPWMPKGKVQRDIRAYE